MTAARATGPIALDSNSGGVAGERCTGSSPFDSRVLCVVFASTVGHHGGPLSEQQVKQSGVDTVHLGLGGVIRRRACDV